MKILLRIAYDGRNFRGWQVQKNGNTVQAELCRAAAEVYGTPVGVTGCSRTDSGVHARCFYCTLTLPEGAPDVPEARLPEALNCKLPESVSVFAAQKVPDDLHPRYDVKEKTYEYVIDDSPMRDPFLAGRAWHVKRYPGAEPLDVMRMDAAAKAFIGKKDFKAFMAAGSDIKDTVRTVFDASVRRVDGKVVFSVTADGFLYNMVRIMTGTLVSVAGTQENAAKAAGNVDENKLTDPAEKINRIIESGSRQMAGRTAPPDGLYLVSVRYARAEVKI